MAAQLHDQSSSSGEFNLVFLIFKKDFNMPSFMNLGIAENDDSQGEYEAASTS